MPDYKKMYLEMARKTENAIQILIEVQQKCEEMYINAPEPSVTLLNSESLTLFHGLFLMPMENPNAHF